jgi:hypothetical protein
MQRQRQQLPGRRDSADILYGATNVLAAPTQKDRQTLPSSKRRPISKQVHVEDITKILIMDFEDAEARNDCAGECHQQFNRPTV